MLWNYQILRHKGIDGNEDWYGIHEVYRDKDGKIMACTEGNGTLPSECPESISVGLKMMLKDCKDYPVHGYDNVPEAGAEELGDSDE